MFYSVPLTMAAYAKLFERGVCQLTARIPYEGVTQRDTVVYFSSQPVGLRPL
jgi:hypothetical protein